MVVAVDTFLLSSRYRHTGTGVYLYNLLSELLRASEGSGGQIEFRGFAPKGERWDSNGLSSRLLSVRENWAAGHPRAWMLGGMALATLRERPDLVFMPTAHASVAMPFTPVVTTILDAMHGQLPASMLEVGRSVRLLTSVNAKMARRIITISSRSKQDLVETMGIDPDRIDVIFLGYDKSLYNGSKADADASANLLSRLKVRRPYVLHHGMVQLRKNLVRLIEAWDLMTAKCGRKDFQLVLAGPPGLGHDKIREAAEASPNRERIVFTGALETADLAMLVKNATLCVIPSLYEGFCLPLLEAMACGVPTVASNSSCIPEVSGSVLEYFDPLSVEEMAEVIGRAIGDSELRDRLRRKGLERASEFSWERCARQTLEILAGTAGKHD